MRAWLLSLLSLPSVFSVICPQGYFLINGQKCLKMYWDKVSQPAAESTCKNDGGTLVIIRNAIDNQAVYKFANEAGVTQIWIGLTCFENTTSSCFWDDASGTAASYSNFATTWTTFIGNCTQMYINLPPYVAKWTAQNCNYQNDQYSYSLLPFVCEVPPTEPLCSMFQCNNEYSYNGYAYFKSGDSILANGTDPKRCAGLGKVVSIHSKMEIDYIRRLYRGTNIKQIYIGATSEIVDRFEWFDGTPWDFNYMDPLNFQKGKCLVMDVWGFGLWSQVDCDQMLPYLCKYKIPPQPTMSLPVAEKTPEVLLDASNCNTTYYLAPGSISSFGYPNYNSPSSFCTWQLRALGPYRLGIYFDFWATYGALNIYNETGENIGQLVGTYDRSPFSKFTQHNVARITFEPRPKTGTQVDRGFHAVVLPL